MDLCDQAWDRAWLLSSAGSLTPKMATSYTRLKMAARSCPGTTILFKLILAGRSLPLPWCSAWGPNPGPLGERSWASPHHHFLPPPPFRTLGQCTQVYPKPITPTRTPTLTQPVPLSCFFSLCFFSLSNHSFIIYSNTHLRQVML